MNDENMGKITISLSVEGEKLLRDRAKRNLRSISKEVEHLVKTTEERDKWNQEAFHPLKGIDLEEYKKLMRAGLPNYQTSKDKVK